MKKAIKITGYLLAGIIILLLFTYLFFMIKWRLNATNNRSLLGPPAPTLKIADKTFRDLNKNGELDLYEDIEANLNHRVEDLLQQMNLEEKAGLLFINMIAMNEDGTLSEVPRITEPFTIMMEPNISMIAQKKMNHFNIVQATTPKAMFEWHNALQKVAESTRLGIPITIASDPRHGALENIGASIPTPFFSRWCAPLGFAATRDSALMREFANMARQEYLALGIRLALHPTADLATEPRWGRINSTFGEDANLSAKLTKAYVLGFQGEKLGANSVACMTKHFPGAGPQKDGEDAHFPYGKEQVYPGNNFDYHLIPFEKGAFEANTAQIMPYYGLPVGQTKEAVAFGFNKEIITDLLRNQYGFKGVVCTDWGIISASMVKPASAWGVEHLTESERIAKVLDAGCDMFGGESLPDLVIDLVNTGKISEERLNTSVRRILKDKFMLGLFDNPYLAEENLEIVGNKTFIEKGREAQRKSLVLLKNENRLLPLDKSTKVFVDGFDKTIVQQFFTVVEKPEEATINLIKLATPYDPRSKYLLELGFHQGRLTFKDKERNRLISLLKSKPSITVIDLERPAIFPEINQLSKSVIASFECQEDILLELITGQFSPSGKLPFEIPSSVSAVEAQKEDVPYDSQDPLYTFGHGLQY